jgi:hypothetical protein
MRHLPRLQSTLLHGEAQRLRYTLRLTGANERDPHARLDQKLAAAPALLQQRD